METKLCKICNIEKCIKGRRFCKVCFRESRKPIDKKFRENNKEKIKKYREEHKEYFLNYSKKYNKEYYSINKESENIRSKRYRELFPNKEYFEKYYIDNKDKINNRLRNKRQIDTLYKLSKNIRSSISNNIKKKNYTKSSKSYDILGCTFDELKIYLESRFESWMTWDNHGSYNGNYEYGWDIDHIIPLSSATTEEELIKLCHYTNLQPLDSKINRYEKRDFV
jgi:hypothetical protein